ncbi:MAG: hypothetical protein ACYTF4_09920 [Planctomycetota bacterium]
MSATRADLGGRTSQEQEQASRFEHHLGDLKELLAGVAARIDNEVEPVLAALQQREQDAGVERGLAELKAQLGTIFEQVDERVAGALSGMESRGAEADAEAASRLSELAGGVTSSSIAPWSAWRGRCRRREPTWAAGRPRSRNRPPGSSTTWVI